MTEKKITGISSGMKKNTITRNRIRWNEFWSTQSDLGVSRNDPKRSERVTKIQGNGHQSLRSQMSWTATWKTRTKTTRFITKTTSYLPKLLTFRPRLRTTRFSRFILIQLSCYSLIFTALFKTFQTLLFPTTSYLWEIEPVYVCICVWADS